MKKITYMSNFILALLVIGLLTTLISIAMSLANDTELLNYSNASGAQMSIGLEVSGSWQQAATQLTDNNYSPVKWLGLMQVVLLLLINIILIRLFNLYRQGSIFSKKNSQCFSWLGGVLILQFFIVALYPALILSIINIIDSTELKRIVSINDTDIIGLIIGLIIYVIGWIMKQACQLQQDQELVI
ncbi:hypothetical protein P20652_0007 [Pseudoalteromonas sp. BSi20652]|uniref:DUF2975 domain-containing protein n=1 Tax=Pseudoalteromonas sp. BSi20652 TaxID=388384 RepID=UPI0002318B3F|nr:DUF2975 domain-containing protein [Pseudoalteromonas sp. BSi20652]GAA58156.1 hypothetical protein P20652_0007 [Pseudoalteromonas sp. BSi20652]